MSPEQAIAQLDRALALNGAPATLRRTVGNGPSTQVHIDAPVTAFVRRAEPATLIGAQVQAMNEVVISPTDITRAQWPGPMPAGWVGDWEVPRKGDTVILQEGPRMVMASRPLRMAGQLVRLELTVQG